MILELCHLDSGKGQLDSRPISGQPTYSSFSKYLQLSVLLPRHPSKPNLFTIPSVETRTTISPATRPHSAGVNSPKKSNVLKLFASSLI